MYESVISKTSSKLPFGMLITLILKSIVGPLKGDSIPHSSFDTYNNYSLSWMKIVCENGVSKMVSKEVVPILLLSSNSTYYFYLLASNFSKDSFKRIPYYLRLQTSHKSRQNSRETGVDESTSLKAGSTAGKHGKGIKTAKVFHALLQQLQVYYSEVN